ncbi:hypothetical protein T492DRAFT_1058602 [Pavlovales sp. CCMP2436]|nr:hypothetical protein T492DRAFT_1058602 [Pavlovales sp. CCMP2436]
MRFVLASRWCRVGVALASCWRRVGVALASRWRRVGVAPHNHRELNTVAWPTKCTKPNRLRPCPSTTSTTHSTTHSTTNATTNSTRPYALLREIQKLSWY